ncbi:polygalacturonase-like [Iris pallida]|uniref:endo-polygalacturonase n=1 Tax=Iris pallida TaxID=29817 RepID=A0AAX6FZT6_IRIPA|nr:polygalacturonase-like [Iris pallida]
MAPILFLTPLLLLLFFHHSLSCHGSPAKRVFNVDDYGAKADGVTDDKPAFLGAWHEACSSPVPSVLEVPENKHYLLAPPFNFSGPCQSRVTVLIKGTLEAPPNVSYWDNLNRRQWILFYRVHSLAVRGGGMIDGKGQDWWRNSCKKNHSLPCLKGPTALNFSLCRDVKIENLRMKDSQQFHLNIDRSSNVKLSKLFIVAPATSPNTDGIHMFRARNIVIADCYIGTGDDCISITGGSRDIKARNIVCGPGHGISIGSLGANNTKEHVRNVMVDTATLIGTDNGVRIKTWQGGRGYVKHVTFQNIAMHDVKNPIIVDQNYCDSTIPCHEQRDALTISHVLYKNIMGTSASNVSVSFACSNSASCRGIVLQDINLLGNSANRTQSLCNNVHLIGRGDMEPPLCV